MSYNHQYHGLISLPSFIKQTDQINAFIEDIYPASILQNPLENSMFFIERAILCSKNKTVKEINSRVLNMVNGEKITLFSADTIQSDSPETTTENIPEEYLHSLTTSGLPPAKLELKVGLPVMLLRNLNPEKGLCNGTRCIIHQIGEYVLKVKVLGSNSDQIELIPRFTLSTLPGQLPFILTRKQFPIKVSFAMTVNKSQGQSLKKVAVDLRDPVFTHGQLYVALSRATTAARVSILFSSTNKTQKTEMLSTLNFYFSNNNQQHLSATNTQLFFLYILHKRKFVYIISLYSLSLYMLSLYMLSLYILSLYVLFLYALSLCSLSICSLSMFSFYMLSLSLSLCVLSLYMLSLSIYALSLYALCLYVTHLCYLFFYLHMHNFIFIYKFI